MAFNVIVAAKTAKREAADASDGPAAAKKQKQEKPIVESAIQRELRAHNVSPKKHPRELSPR